MAKLSIKQFQNDDAATEHYLRQVDRMAGGTSGCLAAIREAKWREVLAGGGPLLEAEADAMGETVAETILRVTSARQAWEAIEADKEAARIKAKAAIRNASTPEEMCVALQQYRDLSTSPGAAQ